MSSSLPSKLISEIIRVEFNFLKHLDWEETINGAEVTVSVFSGLDLTPSAMIFGTEDISSPSVFQDIQLGLPGVIYNLICTATGSSGNTYQLIRKLAVLADDNSFNPGTSLELIGQLPDGTVNVPYSEVLTIIGGYPPYEFDDIISGTPPPWMSFNISDNTLVCAGTPDESITTNYNFNPQVRDGPNNLADDPQEMTIVHMVISGDVPNGLLGEVISGAYTQVNGIEPVTYVITSGIFPSGITLAANGTYSGTFTSSGIFNWVVTGTDAVGTQSTVIDTSSVNGITWLMARSAQQLMYSATDPINGPWESFARNHLTATIGQYLVSGIVPNTWVAYRSAGSYTGVIFSDTLDHPSGVIPTDLILITDDADSLRSFDNIVTISIGDRSGFMLSTDYGASYSFVPTPNGKGASRTIAQLNSGRWLLSFSDGANPCGAFYTDAAIPDASAVWTTVTIPGEVDTAGGSPFACNGSAACILFRKVIYRTTSGLVWTPMFTVSGPQSESVASIAIEDVFLIAYASAGDYARSTNAGLTWTNEVLTGVGVISDFVYANGILIACGLENYYSTDLGLTWNTLTLPFTQEFSEFVGVGPIITLAE